MKQNFFKIGLSILIIFLNISFDQISKSRAELQLKGQPPQIYFHDTFRLTFAENTGAFLSLGYNAAHSVKLWTLKILPVILLGGLLTYLFFWSGLSFWQIIAYSFLLGGGMSNIYDRLINGSVIDFMNMGIGNLRSGIFNFADVSILIGFFLMLISMKKGSKEIAGY